MASTARVEQTLLAWLAELTSRLPDCTSESRTLLVAYSGGLDSTVLLAALHRLLAQRQQQGDSAGFRLRAVHVNHGLSPHADDWQQHCSRFCSELGVDLVVRQVTVGRAPGESLEEQAREARYAAFASELGSGEVLLLAHHLDDRLETFWLRLQRGAGLEGLAGMPVTRVFGKGHLWRPLLALPGSVLRDWADANRLEWIEDESNSDTRFDRNFLRQELLPAVAQRWPGYRDSWQRSLDLIAESSGLLAELAASDLIALNAEAESEFLPVAGLHRLSLARQRNLLRHWILQAGHPDPGWQLLHRAVSELLPAAESARPQLEWQGSVLQRYQDRLYLFRQSGAVQTPAGGLTLTAADCRQIAELTSGQLWRQLELPGNGCLQLLKTGAGGLRPEAGTELQVGYRQGGEACKLAGRRTRPLKKILQDAAVLPWLRDRQPLLMTANVVVAIPGIGVAEGFQSGSGEDGLECRWLTRNGLWTQGGSGTL